MSDLLKLLQWMSPAFPVGSFAYSHGLERVIERGDVICARDLRVWLEDVLCHGTGASDATLLSHAMRADDPCSLAELAEALCISRERWTETMEQGRAFLAATNAIYDTTVSELPFPVAVGHVARRLSLPPEDVCAGYLHAFASNLISAAVRFVPLGQSEGQQVLDALHDVISEIAQQAASAQLHDISMAVFGADIAAMEHEMMTTRIFRT